MIALFFVELLKISAGAKMTPSPVQIGLRVYASFTNALQT